MIFFFVEFKYTKETDWEYWTNLNHSLEKEMLKKCINSPWTEFCTGKVTQNSIMVAICHMTCALDTFFFCSIEKPIIFQGINYTHMNRFSTRINQDHPDRPMNDFTIRYFSDFVRFSKFSRKFSLIGKTCHAARSLWKIFCFFSICSIIKKLKFTFTLSRHYTHIARIFPGIYGF